MPLVTISGLPGAGTSTLARAVAAALGLAHVDGGQVFRALAAERDQDVHAFGAEAESDPSIDVELDTRLARRGAEGDVVLESRLAGWIATHEGLPALRVWVECAEGERARRVAAREGSTPDVTAAQNRRREVSEARRYRDYYGIDLADRSPYDLVLDSTATPVEDLLAAVLAAAPGRAGPGSGTAVSPGADAAL
ncbi:MAG TPA: cytidylate kinase family protein [Acidimicrobiales bacterium]|nr:cytidylate kinase family protein [Acidimicrobiales bacterium]